MQVVPYRLTGYNKQESWTVLSLTLFSRSVRSLRPFSGHTTLSSIYSHDRRHFPMAFHTTIAARQQTGNWIVVCCGKTVWKENIFFVLLSCREMWKRSRAVIKTNVILVDIITNTKLSLGAEDKCFELHLICYKGLLLNPARIGHLLELMILLYNLNTANRVY